MSIAPLDLVPGGEVWLFRQRFDLPSGTLAIARLVVTADNSAPAIYINGTLIGTIADSVAEAPITFSVATTLLHPGGANVVAIEVANGGSGTNPSGVSFALTVEQVNDTGLVVTDGTTSVTGVTSIDFTAGATVSGASGVASVAITGGELAIQRAGLAVGTRPALNLIAGPGATITATDDPTLGRVDVTIGASGASGGGAMARIAQIVCDGSTIVTANFTDIPGTYDDLLIVYQARGTTAATTEDLWMTFNGDNGSDYEWERGSFNGTGSGAGGGGEVGYMAIAYLTGGGAAAGHTTTGEILIANYAGSVFHKGAESTTSMQRDVGGAGIWVERGTGHWSNTAPITRITVVAQSGIWQMDQPSHCTGSAALGVVAGVVAPR